MVIDLFLYIYYMGIWLGAILYPTVLHEWQEWVLRWEQRWSHSWGHS